MTTKYFCGISALFLAILLAFTISATAHDDVNSHNIFKGMGDASRALMSKEGYGRSVFTLYVNLDVTIINESGKKAKQEIAGKIGTAFIVRDDGFLLTNNHVIDAGKMRKEYSKKVRELYSTLAPPQRVTLRFKESYKAVDSSGVTFLVSVFKQSDSIDAAILRFEKIDPSRKVFILEDESESLFSPIAVPGSPLGIPNMIGFGHIARAALDSACGDNKEEYLLFMSSLNPGNSGGPLYNLETDKVNGMVTAYLLSNGGNSMISCAVPASSLIKFLDKNLPPRKG